MPKNKFPKKVLGSLLNLIRNQFAYLSIWTVVSRITMRTLRISTVAAGHQVVGISVGGVKVISSGSRQTRPNLAGFIDSLSFRLEKGNFLVMRCHGNSKTLKQNKH